MTLNSQYCIAYLIVDSFCLILTILARLSAGQDAGSETQNRFFRLLLYANMAFLIFDGIWVACTVFFLIRSDSFILSIVNGGSLISIVLCAYFWMCFSLAYFENRFAYNRKVQLIGAIPVALAIAVHVFGTITNQNYAVAEDGTITYGFAHTSILLFAVLYMAAATAAAFERYRSASRSEERRTSLIFLSFMAAPTFAAFFDSLVPGSPIAAPAITLSIMFTVLSLKESRISTDGLTGLNNRRRADAYLEEAIDHASPTSPIALFVMDMDNFKEINDTYGHLEGDQALKLMADALRKACDNLDAFAARLGGDEFTVVCTRPTEGGPQQVIDTINDCISMVAKQAQVPYHLSCSIGYAECVDQNTPLNSLLGAADTMLYEKKQSLRNMSSSYPGKQAQR